MSDQDPQTIVVERLMPHPPEKIWRALTETRLIEQWLMKNDFTPRLGARFTFVTKPIGEWNGIVHCEVTQFDPPRRLAYTWRGGSSANRARGAALDSLVQWTLTPEPGGTRVRMEQSGFGPQNRSAYETMSRGWPGVIERLEQVSGAASAP